MSVDIVFKAPRLILLRSNVVSYQYIKFSLPWSKDLNVCNVSLFHVQRQQATPDYTSQPASTTTATATQFLPPPPSKQSIKAANAMKMKPATKVQNPAPAPAAGNFL